MAMTTAERRGYRMICGTGGRMLVVACDQRGGMRQALTPDAEARRGIADATLGDVKIAIARHLAHGAAVLVDPVCALPRLVDEDHLSRDTALLVGLDASGWETSPEGLRVSTMVPGVTARRVRELGGTGGKVMVYLRSDSAAASEANLATLARVVEDFRAEDLLLVTEFLTYALPGEAPEAYAERTGDLAVGGVRLCLEAGANVLKIPYPGSPSACAEVTRVAGEAPWAVLSAGVDHATFLGQVEAAMANGASGVIAGRSLWKDCVSLDMAETERRLREVARPRLEELRAILERHPA